MKRPTLFLRALQGGGYFEANWSRPLFFTCQADKHHTKLIPDRASCIIQELTANVNELCLVQASCPRENHEEI